MGSTRVKWRDRTPENDIKYGGFLSYRHLRIIGWVCLVIAQIGVILKLEVKLAPDTTGIVEAWNIAINVFAGLPVPLFLLANLSTILQKRGNFKALFLKFGGMAVGMYLLANLLVFHYGHQALTSLGASQNWADSARFFGLLLPAFGKTGYTLNIFIDMLLVVLMFFFANYEPEVKAFQGKRIILFRLLILLPIAYEVAGIFLKYRISMGYLEIPSPVFFLLPSKPPLIFAAFLLIIIGLKIGKVSYLHRPGHTLETYEEHIKTNAHSLKISIGIAVVFVIIAIIDILVLFGIMVGVMYQYRGAYPDLDEETLLLLVYARTDVFEQIGFGGAAGLLLAAPLVILFSYTKTHKNPKIDTLIPVAGIAMIAFVLLEGTFQVITCNMPLFLEKIKEAIANVINGGGETDPAAEGASLLASLVNHIHL